MIRNIIAIGMLLIVMLFVSCKNKGGDDVVAKAYDNYLRMGDLESVVAKGMSSEDSAAVVSNYINQWLQQQVVLHKAEKNVSKDFKEELQAYKNSLITYEYERLVIGQMLDTSVSDEEVKSYYEKHRDDFILKTNIVRAIYVKVANDSPCLKDLKSHMSRNPMSDDDLMEIQKMATKYGQDYRFDEETWIPFQNLQSFMPIETYNEVDFLRSNRHVVVSDDQSTYVLEILDYKVVDEVSPLEYEYGRIRTAILNSRKIDIIKNMQRELLRKAEENKDIERYK
ncbi:MAG: hypothetical protein SPJ13_05400 [Bacteroidales bacterium]|nr:hypothetical protein [Bacteroidales bacterium]